MQNNYFGIVVYFDLHKKKGRLYVIDYANFFDGPLRHNKKDVKVGVVRNQ
jgi:hypothetical protein